MALALPSRRKIAWQSDLRGPLRYMSRRRRQRRRARSRLTRAAPDLNDGQLTTLIREGLTARGMPAVSVSDVELAP